MYCIVEIEFVDFLDGMFEVDDWLVGVEEYFVYVVVWWDEVNEVWFLIFGCVGVVVDEDVFVFCCDGDWFFCLWIVDVNIDDC